MWLTPRKSKEKKLEVKYKQLDIIKNVGPNKREHLCLSSYNGTENLKFQNLKFRTSNNYNQKLLDL